MSSKHKTTRAWRIRPNGIVSISVGNILMLEAFFKKYELDRAITGPKAKGTYLAKLTESIVVYKLKDNFSIFKAHKFMMDRDR